MDILNTTVVKRNGERPSEVFRQDKLHDSIRAACLSVRSPIGEAEMIAKSVCDAVISWLEVKSEVTSNDLRRKATETLTIHHPEAAYLYQQHRLVI
jgi:hypothetical protein